MLVVSHFDPVHPFASPIWRRLPDGKRVLPASSRYARTCMEGGEP